MKKCFVIFTVLVFTLILSAENQPMESNNNLFVETGNQPVETASCQDEEDFFTRLKFGIGADFSGTAGELPGSTYAYFLKNQLGVSAGLDFNWLVFKKASGRGEGNLYLGFGFDFQYWIPTTWMNRDNNPGSDSYYDDSSVDYYFLLHYMRIPVTLNMAYELKAGIGSLKSVEPRISLGMNNNILKFGWGSSDKEEYESMSEGIKELNRRIYNYKISGTWAFGVSFVFTNKWFFSTSIGGDFGSSKYKSHFFYERPYQYDSNGHKTGNFEDNSQGRFLYGHHEFIMFETGYRF